jgi:predicted enzyme related to lactoylglutathione lyase
VVVGEGKPAFSRDARLQLELQEEHRFGNGVVYLRYHTQSWTASRSKGRFASTIRTGPRGEEFEHMNEVHPFIDYANLPAPDEGIIVTMFITVRSIARSRAFYRDVLDGTVVLEENPCMVKLANSWIIMNPGGPPTPDKPDISVVNYEPGNTTSIFMNLRVADIDDCYRRWSQRGAEFLTPPIDRGAEIRCYMRDPDGYLIEVGQSTGLLSGHLAAKRPEDLPG